MNSLARSAAAVLTAIVLCILAGAGLLSLTATAPAEPARQALLQDLGSIPEQEFWPVVLWGLELAEVDSFSECISLGHALSSSSLPFADRPAGTVSAQEGGCASLRSALENTTSADLYLRFFHGASAVERIGLPLLGLTGLRVVTVVALLSVSLLVIRAAWLSYPAIGALVGVFLLFSIAAPIQGLSLTHGLSTLVGILGAWLAMRATDRGPTHVAIAAGIAGVCYALIAQLFTPMAFMLLSSTLVAARLSKMGKVYGPTVAGAALAWTLGYGLSMLARFAWAYAVLGRPALDEGHWAALSRGSSSLLQPLTGLWYSISHTLTFALPILGLILTVAIIAIGRRGRHPATVIERRALLASVLPLAIAATWLMAMGGHNFHPWVTGVPLAMIMYGGALAILPRETIQPETVARQ